jgi:pimeloyl-ACP methyl ester carboxylesterase
MVHSELRGGFQPQVSSERLGRWGRAAALLLSFCLVGVAPAGGSRLWCSLEAGPFDVGFQLLETYDPDRTFDSPKQAPRGDSATPPQPERPVQISLFYPAVPTKGAVPVPFREFVFHSAREAAYRAPSADEKRAAIARVRGPVRSDGELERFDELLAEATASFLEAPPSPGTFPLILLAPGRNGSPLSELIIMEYLASYGFVVAAIPSQGSRTPQVTGEPEDLENQVQDMEHVMTVLDNFEFSNQQRVGAIGYSMGGAAVTLLEMRNPKVEALVTLDGSEASQQRWASLRGVASYDPATMEAPRLRIYGGGSERSGQSIYRAISHSRRYLIGLPLMRHADFTSWALINDWLWNRDPQRVSGPRAAYQLISRQVLAFMQAYLVGNERSLDIVEKGPSRRDYPRGFFNFKIMKPRR